MGRDNQIVMRPWVLDPLILEVRECVPVVDRERLVELGLELELPLSL